MNDESFNYRVETGRLIVEERQRQTNKQFANLRAAANKKAMDDWRTLFDVAYSIIPSQLLDLYGLEYPAYTDNGYYPLPPANFRKEIELPLGKVAFSFAHIHTGNNIFRWDLTNVSYEDFRMEYPFDWETSHLEELCKRHDTDAMRNVKPELTWTRFYLPGEDEGYDPDAWLNELLFLAANAANIYALRYNDYGTEHQICAMYAESTQAALQQQYEQQELMNQVQREQELLSKALEPVKSDQSDAEKVMDMLQHILRILDYQDR